MVGIMMLRLSFMGYDGVDSRQLERHLGNAFFNTLQSWLLGHDVVHMSRLSPCHIRSSHVSRRNS